MVSDAAVVRVQAMFKLRGPAAKAVWLKVKGYNRCKNNPSQSIFSSSP